MWSHISSYKSWSSVAETAVLSNTFQIWFNPSKCIDPTLLHVIVKTFYWNINLFSTFRTFYGDFLIMNAMRVSRLPEIIISRVSVRAGTLQRTKNFNKGIVLLQILINPLNKVFWLILRRWKTQALQSILESTTKTF